MSVLLSGCQSTRWNGPTFAASRWEATDNAGRVIPTAESAYATACQLESDGDERCVDGYFQAAESSWRQVRETVGCVDCSSIRTWQLYHSSVAKLIRTGQRFGRLAPSRGLEIRGRHGSQFVPVRCHGFVWQPDDFNEFILVGSYSSDGLPVIHRCQGLGVPLLVKRKRCSDEPLRKREMLFSATAVLQTSSSDETEPSFSLDLYDPLRVQEITLGGDRVAIHQDLSAPFAYRLHKSGNTSLEAFRSPNATANAAGLFAIEPYQPGKIPLIFIHGLLSDPTTWVALVNELRARPEIRDRYQFWAFEYHTGEPFIRSARTLRNELAEAIHNLDPDGQDPALSKMVLIGHSMGGLIAKLQITSSRTLLWDSLANRPFDQIVASDETLADLSEMLFFEPQPAVRRVIFIGTPHRGAGSSQRLVGRITSLLVKQPEDRKARHRALIAHNPDVFSPEVEKRIPTSIDILNPQSRILQAVESLPIARGVALHSIIGDKGHGIGEPTDGVVPVNSALHPCTESEIVVCAKHTKIQSTWEAIHEVLGILRRHDTESDVASIVGGRSSE